MDVLVGNANLLKTLYVRFVLSDVIAVGCITSDVLIDQQSAAGVVIDVDSNIAQWWSKLLLSVEGMCGLSWRLVVARRSGLGLNALLNQDGTRQNGGKHESARAMAWCVGVVCNTKAK